MSDYALIFIDLFSSAINSKTFQGYLHTNRDMKTFFDIYFAKTEVYLLTGSKLNCNLKQNKNAFYLSVYVVSRKAVSIASLTKSRALRAKPAQSRWLCNSLPCH